MKLRKKTYQTKEAENLIDRSFKELKSSIDGVSLTNFFDTYNRLFFQIPKTGTLSHSFIFNKSGEYLQKPNLKSSTQIRELNNKIIDLEKKLADLETENSRLEADNTSKDYEITLLKKQ